MAKKKLGTIELYKDNELVGKIVNLTDLEMDYMIHSAFNFGWMYNKAWQRGKQKLMLSLIEGASTQTRSRQRTRKHKELGSTPKNSIIPDFKPVIE